MLLADDTFFLDFITKYSRLFSLLTFCEFQLSRNITLLKIYFKICERCATCCRKNVFGTCADKTDADPGIDIINLMLKSRLLIPNYFATCISLTAHFMTNAISLFLLPTASHTHSLSLCLSAILLSSPLSPFDIKMLSEDFWVINESTNSIKNFSHFKGNIYTKNKYKKGFVNVNLSTKSLLFSGLQRRQRRVLDTSNTYVRSQCHKTFYICNL